MGKELNGLEKGLVRMPDKNFFLERIKGGMKHSAIMLLAKDEKKAYRIVNAARMPSFNKKMKAARKAAGDDRNILIGSMLDMEASDAKQYVAMTFRDAGVTVYL
jgi:hypothetical protein